MKAIKTETDLVTITDSFEKLLKEAKEKLEPYYSLKEVSYQTVYFKIKDNTELMDFDCCDNEKCIEKSKADIREQYGKGTHIEECWYDNDGDHEKIEYCTQCGKPLNEQLTWYEDELNYIESEQPYTIEFLKEEAFLIYCILDNTISLFEKNNSNRLKIALDIREQFFQRIIKLSDSINEILK